MPQARTVPGAELVAVMPSDVRVCFRISHTHPAFRRKRFSFRETLLEKRTKRSALTSLDRGNHLAVSACITHCIFTAAAASCTRCVAVGCIGLSPPLNGHRVGSGQLSPSAYSYENAYKHSVVHMHRLSVSLMRRGSANGATTDTTT